MSNDLRLVALVGAKGCGKSTAAQYLVDYHAFKRLRFGGMLKEMLITMGLTREQVDGDQKEVPCDLLGGKTPRWAMQTLGTEWGRELIDVDLWTKVTIKLAQEVLDRGERVVIDDLRFHTEAAKIDELGGEIYRVRRFDAEANCGDHASEREWCSMAVDGEIDNNFNISNLRHGMASILVYRNGIIRTGAPT
jgi:hypothetical protein